MANVISVLGFEHQSQTGTALAGSGARALGSELDKAPLSSPTDSYQRLPLSPHSPCPVPNQSHTAALTSYIHKYTRTYGTLYLYMNRIRCVCVCLRNGDIFRGAQLWLPAHTKVRWRRRRRTAGYGLRQDFRFHSRKHATLGGVGVLRGGAATYLFIFDLKSALQRAFRCPTTRCLAPGIVNERGRASKRAREAPKSEAKESEHSKEEAPRPQQREGARELLGHMRVSSIASCHEKGPLPNFNFHVHVRMSINERGLSLKTYNFLRTRKYYIIR